MPSVLLVMGNSSVTLDKLLKVSNLLPMCKMLHPSFVVRMSRAVHIKCLVQCQACDQLPVDVRPWNSVFLPSEM